MSLTFRPPRFLAVAALLLPAPGPAHASQAACEPEPAAGRTALEGTVLDVETSHPLHGSGVTASWTEGSESVQRKTETARDGRFRFCDVPEHTFVSVQASWFDQRSDVASVPIEDGAARVVLRVASPHVVVSGRVIEDETGAPLAGASVRVGAGASQLSNEDGAFRFERVPPGLQDVIVERLGFATVQDSAFIEFGTLPDLSIRLSVRAVPLDPIVIVVRSMVLARAGFYVREGRGLGTFIARQEIEERPPLTSSDLLRRVTGVRLVRDRFGDQLAIGRGNCPYRFIIDGVRINQGYSIDEMPPQWLEGLEVYHGLSQVPMEFSAGPSEANATCGLIVIWTRNRR